MTEQVFVIVENSDGQYSILPVDSAIPAGWSSIGWSGSRAAALERMETLSYEKMPPEHRSLIDLQRKWQEGDEQIREETRRRAEIYRQRQRDQQ